MSHSFSNKDLDNILYNENNINYPILHEQDMDDLPDIIQNNIRDINNKLVNLELMLASFNMDSNQHYLYYNNFKLSDNTVNILHNIVKNNIIHNYHKNINNHIHNINYYCSKFNKFNIKKNI